MTFLSGLRAPLLLSLLLSILVSTVTAKEYPTHSTHANGISIAYQDFGDKNNEVVILVMGLGAQLIHWDDDLVLGLVNAGYRVIRFDNRDAGWSQKMYQGGEPGFMTGIRHKLGWSLNAPYKLDDMAADVIGLMDSLGIQQANLVGASMGGMISQIAAAQYPDRVKTLTSIMSTSGAAHLPEGTIEVQFRSEDLSREQVINNSIAFWKQLDAGRSNYTQEQWFARTARGYDRMYYPPGFARQIWAILDSGDRVELLKTIKQPTLVIHGSADALLPPAGGQHTAELVQGSRYVEIEGMGHSLDDTSRTQALGEILSLLRAASQ